MNNNEILWKELCDAENNYYKSRKKFIQNYSGKNKLITKALYQPNNRGVALRVINILDSNEKKIIFKN